MIDPNDYSPEVFAALKAEFPEEFDPLNWVPAPPTPPPPGPPVLTPAEVEAALLVSLHAPFPPPNDEFTARDQKLIDDWAPALNEECHAALVRLANRGKVKLPGGGKPNVPPRREPPIETPQGSGGVGGPK